MTRYRGETAYRRPALDLTCPTCKRADALSRYEAQRRYQCASCTAREEGCGTPWL